MGHWHVRLLDAFWQQLPLLVYIAPNGSRYEQQVTTMQCTLQYEHVTVYNCRSVAGIVAQPDVYKIRWFETSKAFETLKRCHSKFLSALAILIVKDFVLKLWLSWLHEISNNNVVQYNRGDKSFQQNFGTVMLHIYQLIGDEGYLIFMQLYRRVKFMW